MTATLPGPAVEFPEGLTVAELGERDWASGNGATQLAGSGLWAVQAFVDKVGGGTTEPVDQVLGDLLADLMHLADALGVGWDYLTYRAAVQHDEEIAA